MKFPFFPSSSGFYSLEQKAKGRKYEYVYPIFFCVTKAAKLTKKKCLGNSKSFAVVKRKK